MLTPKLKHTQLIYLWLLIVEFMPSLELPALGQVVALETQRIAFSTAPCEDSGADSRLWSEVFQGLVLEYLTPRVALWASCSLATLVGELEVSG